LVAIVAAHHVVADPNILRGNRQRKRRTASEKITSFRPDRTQALDQLARQIARWAKDHGGDVGAAEPAIPNGMV
jgi:hypothetical protein